MIYRKIITFLSSTKLFFFVLLWLMLLLVMGTVAQKTLGLYVAQDRYFSSWYFLGGGLVPLPGGALTISLMFISLFIKTFRDYWSLKKLGSLITHISVLVLLAGGMVTAIFSQDWVMRIPEGESKYRMADISAGVMPPPLINLPFSIKLVDFKMEVYPGTNKARRYTSDVIVEDGEVSWPVHISMNHPLRYKGYTFYQSSFEEGQESDVTILAVVKNPARMMPYIASIIMCLGLMIHLIQRIPSLFRRNESLK